MTMNLRTAANLQRVVISYLPGQELVLEFPLVLYWLAPQAVADVPELGLTCARTGIPPNDSLGLFASGAARALLQNWRF